MNAELLLMTSVVLGAVFGCALLAIRMVILALFRETVEVRCRLDDAIWRLERIERRLTPVVTVGDDEDVLTPDELAARDMVYEGGGWPLE